MSSLEIAYYHGRVARFEREVDHFILRAASLENLSLRLQRPDKHDVGLLLKAFQPEWKDPRDSYLVQEREKDEQRSQTSAIITSNAPEISQLDDSLSSNVVLFMLNRTGGDRIPGYEFSRASPKTGLGLRRILSTQPNHWLFLYIETAHANLNQP